MSHQLSENVTAEINSPVHFLLSLIAEEEAKNSCTEENARKIFDTYCIDENNETLQPLDVRKMLFDILDAFKWPLVVTDEERSDMGGIQIIFVFLQDRPLHKLLELVAKDFTPEDLQTSRLVTFDPTQAIQNPCFEKALFQQVLFIYYYYYYFIFFFLN
ncbi:hypothetical protein RFI_16736 [Reticulomyxa filosa]|uniref:Uncharacterized protein n=1 Tax=Reticulomyxa filosa TaxID=46433 RepID=X6N2J4_RETFI|nr:hypothetical protein RFI_16736 [Reticulomyxa filosa]|eukprot:ETO20480.1 hypothetical protein RFI_16736 [Reticulomyxa filosa]